MERKTKQDEAATTQRDRFIKTACELGAEDDTEALDWVLGKVLPPRAPKAPDSEIKVLKASRDD